MSRTYEVHRLSEANKLGYPMGIYAYYNEDEFKWCNPYGLWELEDGKPTRLVGTDGGELLLRNWSWVKEELQKAFEDGYRQGYKLGYHDAVRCDEPEIDLESGGS